MEDRYFFETFSADVGEFDQAFTSYLNSKRMEHWKVKDCAYCHDEGGTKTFASCIFKRKR